MVRHFPIGKGPRNNPILSHKLFVFAFIVATVAIVSFLCGKKKTKRTGSSSSRRKTTKADENTELLVSKTSDPTNEATYVNVVENNNNDSRSPPESTIDKNENKELPPPPRLASIRASSYHVGGSSRSHGAKLTSSMSMRLSGPLKGLKKGAKKDEKRDADQILEFDNKLFTREDSVWKKTIILGGKCKIPDEDEDDIILDENGQRITTFHRKPSCSSSMSRQSSIYINQDVIRDEQQQQNQKDPIS